MSQAMCFVITNLLDSLFSHAIGHRSLVTLRGFKLGISHSRSHINHSLLEM